MPAPAVKTHEPRCPVCGWVLPWNAARLAPETLATTDRGLCSPRCTTEARRHLLADEVNRRRERAAAGFRFAAL